MGNRYGWDIGNVILRRLVSGCEDPAMWVKKTVKGETVAREPGSPGRGNAASANASLPRSRVGESPATLRVVATDGPQERPQSRSHAGAWERDRPASVRQTLERR